MLAKEGVAVPMSDLFGKAGLELLEQVQLGRAYRLRVVSLLELIDAFDRAIALLAADSAERLRRDRGYLALQTIPGIGQTLAAIVVAEIGDISRFAGTRQLACWAGLTPRHYESDTTVKRGSISKQGSRLVHWAAVEAVQRQPFGSKLRADYDRIALRCGKPITKVACARKMIHKVFYALRDGHVRSLHRCGRSTLTPRPPWRAIAATNTPRRAEEMGGRRGLTRSRSFRDDTERVRYRMSECGYVTV